MASKRAIIRQLQQQLQEADAQIRHLAKQASRAFEQQITIAALITRLTPDGAAVLPLELRKQALEEEWGYETMVLEGEDDKPMIVRVVKKPPRTKLRFGGKGS